MELATSVYLLQEASTEFRALIDAMDPTGALLRADLRELKKLYELEYEESI